MLKDYFNKTVEIQRQVATDNGFGGITTTWTTYLSINCLIDLIAGTEQQIAKQFIDSATHVLMTKVGYNISSKNRINDDGNIYRILYVDEPFGKHTEILLEYVGVDNV